MAKTYSELTQQIHQLQIQAEARRLSEAKGVIRTINEAIATYGLTVADLTFAQAVSSPAALPVASSVASPVTVAEKRPAVATKTAGPAAVKSGGRGYSDGAGNSWTGRGPRPKWLREALAAGDSLSKYEIASGSKALAAVKSKVPVKYRNIETGDSWTGRGMRPTWLSQAITSGRSLAEFEVMKSNSESVNAAAPLAWVPALAPTPMPAPAVKVAAKSTPAKKAVIAVKAPAKKAAVAATPAKKASSASARKAKTASVSTKSANALQASAAQAHVPVAAAKTSDDAGVIAASTAVPGTAELVPVPTQQV